MSNREDISVVADVYADALLRSAGDRASQDEVAAELADLVAYMEQHPKFAGFMTLSTVDDEPRRESLDRLFRGKMSDTLLNVLQVLNNRRRSELIPAIARCVQTRVEGMRNQQEVVVHTALPLDDRTREMIKRRLSVQLGKEALITEKADPALIGGIVIHVGDLQIDASVAGQIRGMQKRLMVRASAEIHRGDGYSASE
jgi:F-type H+-transporting ATPase subunit delta